MNPTSNHLRKPRSVAAAPRLVRNLCDSRHAREGEDTEVAHPCALVAAMKIYPSELVQSRQARTAPGRPRMLPAPSEARRPDECTLQLCSLGWGLPGSWGERWHAKRKTTAFTNMRTILEHRLTRSMAGSFDGRVSQNDLPSFLMGTALAVESVLACFPEVWERQWRA